DLGPFAKESWPEPAKGFAAMVARIDRDMGRLLDRLRKHGIDENTLVLFTSDNGPHSEGGHKSKTFNSSGPLKGQKRSLHEGGIRVPMIARWPGRIPAGTTSAQVAGFQDLLPTFARIGGATANVPRDIDGVSIASSLLEATPKIVPRSLYWAFYEGRGGQAVRNGRWKAVQQPYHTKVRLYDLKDDIGEQHDLAAKRPKLVAKLSEIMKQSYAPSDRWKFKPRRR
ncbi:MAG: N-acetylgalactosamine-6-sulfatase, partial [Planctomycetes bacterium]|nr:N-acetylgalactosamine-6-sulfatase [Planctomycetota bacterium]